MNLPKDKADEYRAQARRLREKLDGLSRRASGLHAEEDDALGQPRQGHGAALAQRHRRRLLHQRRRRARGCRRAARLSGRAAAQGLPELQPRPGPAADLLRHGLLPRYGPRRRRGADPLRRRSATGTAISSARTTARSCETSIPLHLEFAGKRKHAQRDALRAGGPAREVLGAADEAGARRLPLQVLHDRDDPGAPLRSTGSISPTTRRRSSTSSPTSRAAISASGSSSPTTTTPSAVGTFTEPVQIIDPVNAENNVSRLYTAAQADAIVDAALDAGDAIDAALAAPTKQRDRPLLAEGLRLLLPGVRHP